jgi:hypothetical protein
MTTPSFEWQFGGWLQALPAGAAWGVVALVALAGLALVIWLYRNTLRQIPPLARGCLSATRAVLVVVVLLCLANPARVERGKRDTSNRDTLAVLVDRSASMNTPDHRGVTRLSGALRLWKAHEAEAHESFSKIDYYRFSIGTRPSTNLQEAIEAQEPGGETRLFSALEQTLAASPAAVVCLTDGLDTTSRNADRLAAEAQQRGVPIYFATGNNRAHSGELLNIREVKAPAVVLRHAEFTASVVIDAGAAQATEIPVELYSGQSRLAYARLPVSAGLNTIPWAVPITAGEAGKMGLEFRVGEGSRQQTASCNTYVKDHTSVRLLYYQGALQWGYRFLLAALQSDPSFQMTSILNPALGVRMNVGVNGQATLDDLPSDASQLAQFQIVVLAHVFASQLSPAQQKALVDYVRGGGAVLFIAPDTNAARQFSGTLVEQMLPVAFDVNDEDNSREILERGFRDQMAATRARSGEEGIFQDETGHHGEIPPLHGFALPEGAVRSAISDLFNGAESMPRFCAHAKVRSVKAGATVLAVSRGADRVGSQHVLLAKQQFGEGFSVALTTDLLWRWKMALKSDSHAAEKFWQQLLLSLAPDSTHGLRLVKTTALASIDHPVVVRVQSSDSNKPSVQAESPSGQRQILALETSNQDEPNQWNATFIPSKAGRWKVSASDGQGSASSSFSISDKPRTTESLNLPPNTEMMRQLAESTGGELIGDDPVFQKTGKSEESGEIRQVRPLWNSAWLLGALLGLYGVELLARRWWKLL